MPILTKEVEVKITNNNAKYYMSLGYEIPMKKASENTRKNTKKDYVYDIGKSIAVNVNDLPIGSHIKIKYLCDYCLEEVITMPYKDYIRRTKEIDKMACRKCFTKKAKETFLLHYDVEHYSKTQDYKEKYCNTCIERYGKSYSKQFLEKSYESFYENTGYKNPLQSPEVREKIKTTLIRCYGVDNPNKSLEIRKKIVNTLYTNSSQKASKQQRYICGLYQGDLNFPIKYYNADIYLPNDNLVIEYDGGGHLLNVVIGRETIEEHNQKEIVRYNILKREGYKQMRIISSKDLLPSDDILLQMLSMAREYFNTTSHTWINFDIDNSKIINAENKDADGIFFNYGELRKIKEL